MTRLLAVTLTILLTASPLPAAFGQSGTVVISNFKFGLVCGTDQSRRICFETKDIPLTNEGLCVYNRQQVPCTWFGYSFDYRLPSREVTLQCEWTSSVPVSEGNPQGMREKDASGGRYEIMLRNDEQHFFNPQYMALPTAFVPRQVQRYTNSCSHMGRKLFEVAYQLRTPEQ
jgi:hypothetical protein